MFSPGVGGRAPHPRHRLSRSSAWAAVSGRSQRQVAMLSSRSLSLPQPTMAVATGWLRVYPSSTDGRAEELPPGETACVGVCHLPLRVGRALPDGDTQESPGATCAAIGAR